MNFKKLALHTKMCWWLQVFMTALSALLVENKAGSKQLLFRVPRSHIRNWGRPDTKVCHNDRNGHQWLDRIKRPCGYVFCLIDADSGFGNVFWCGKERFGTFERAGSDTGFDWDQLIQIFQKSGCASRYNQLVYELGEN